MNKSKWRGAWKKIIFIVLIMVICTFTFAWDTIVNEPHADFKEELYCYELFGNRLPELNEKEPKLGSGIYFHETSCRDISDIALNARQSCSIESALRAHPHTDVFLLITSAVLKPLKETENIFIRELLNYSNFKLRHITFSKYLSNTPLNKIYKSGALNSSLWPVQHSSDVLRYATLFKFGGVYLDLDVLVLKPIIQLKNFAGAESDISLGSGILGFSFDKVGREVASQCVKDLASSYNAKLWGHNGPGVITRIMEKKCKTAAIPEMTKRFCGGFHVFPTDYFQAISFMEANLFFEDGNTEKIIKKTIDWIFPTYILLESIVLKHMKLRVGILISGNCRLGIMLSDPQFKTSFEGVKIKMEYIEENADVKQIIITKINGEFGDDISKLNGCTEIKKKLEKEKKQIENSLLLRSGDVPSKISTAVKQVEETLNKIRKLSERHTNLNKSVDIYEDKVQKVKQMASGYIDKINTLEKACDYLEIIKEIEELSNSLEAALNDKNEKKQILHYIMLNDILKSLSNTKCSHLLLYITETIHYWHNILKEKFTADFEDILKILKWPFVGSVLTQLPTTETINRFQTLIEYLLQIQLDNKEFNSAGGSPDLQPLHLPMVQLIKPLKKRFVYHFMGKKQTNRPDKPEWYFTQILTWIKEHQEFIEKNVQPVYDKFLKRETSAKFEFMSGLVQFVIEKLHYELPHLHYDDSLFSHCIDEALGFEKELRNSLGYPIGGPSVIDVLTQAQIFVKWINMEKLFTLEKMDVMLTSPRAFKPLIPGDLDNNCVTECGNSFLTLLSTITERYEMLLQPGHKLQFLQLQLDLIDDFRVRLLQKLREENSELLSSNFPFILNTVNYVRDVLEEWGVNTVFLHLQYYKSKIEGKAEPSGTVFDEYLSLLGKMRDDLLAELIENVFMEVKAKSMPYRKDKWHAMESMKNLLKPTITATACPMFQVLITKLHQLQEVLAVSLFKQCWMMLAVKIDQYLYEEIVSICIFNEGGALQFAYDITKNLFPLFGQYGNNPEANFKLLKDSCSILSMTKGLALSLKEAVTDGKGDGYDPKAILADVGVYTLPKKEVLSILSRRTDLD